MAQNDNDDNQQQKNPPPPTAAASLKKAMPFSFMDDCDRPACDDIVSKMKHMMHRNDPKTTTTGASSSAAPPPASDETLPLLHNSSSNNGESTTTTTPTSTTPVVDCPPTTGELGRAGWTLLHSMAAWYPEEPTSRDRAHMVGLFAAVARFYPCQWCAMDFQHHLHKLPVRANSRKALCQWLCEQHNVVNQKLGKPLFPCDMKSLDERWRKSSNEHCQGRRRQRRKPGGGSGH